eukprot:CAMPEP_0197528218 /NCGR_PEP_ID=MMETSP1318-20131121/24337_1 /TAXON_ID=552666 /ORGANISM="Partenskyella glossopodia, Strain RCC365" /LENGTH=131 /DNA_ID=CAMNT_0043083223 /DNA_START=667 /DNA_END=1062 /DNA_ORIENTATION=-
MGIALQDIAAHNILVTGERGQDMRVKISNFQMACVADPSKAGAVEHAGKWMLDMDRHQLKMLLHECIKEHKLSVQGFKFLNKLAYNNNDDAFKSTSEALRHPWLSGVQTVDERRVFAVDDVIRNMYDSAIT